MSFTGNPGTGKTTVAMRMAEILHRLGYVRKGHLVAVTRDDLVGQYIGHTAPKTKEVLKKAMGGVLFIDEAYYLYRPENERDYGQEAIEILLQVMENQRDDLVVILAGYKDRMDTFFRSNPGMSSRIAHHLDFPDYSAGDLLRDRRQDAGAAELSLSAPGRAGLRDYLAAPHRCSRISPTRAASATRSTAPACARPAGCSPTGPRIHARGSVDSSPSRTSAPAASFDDASKRDPKESLTMHLGRTTLSKVSDPAAERHRGRHDLGALLVDVAAAVKAISAMTAKGALGGYLGDVGTKNVQGETQQKLDVLANDVMIRSCEWGGLVAGMASEELDEPYRYRPNMPAAATCWSSIRSMARRTPMSTSPSARSSRCCATTSAERRPRPITCSRDGSRSRPATPSTARRPCWWSPSARARTASRSIARSATSSSRIRTCRFPPTPASSPSTPATRASGSRRCIAMSPNARPAKRRSGRDFNMRWIASMVAEVHRILMRGGVFMYPKDTKDPTKPGRLRLLYEANPDHLAHRTGGRPRDHRTRARARCGAAITASARAVDSGLAQRGRTHRALSREHASGADRPTLRPCSTSARCSGPRRGCERQAPHVIRIVTGSSGAGTTTVMKSFAHIFRRENIKAQVIEGDSFHRFDRVEMRERVRRPTAARARRSVTSDPRRTCWPNSPPPWRSTAPPAAARCGATFMTPSRPRSSAASPAPSRTGSRCCQERPAVL
jgi:molybdopterin-guanine dinucleotide biosynthesis protein